MVRWNSAIPLMVLIAFAAIVLPTWKSCAGEALSEPDKEDGPRFFGEAKEVGSLRSIEGVRVKAELGARLLFVNTDAEGRFKLPSFGKDTVAEKVTISCAKQGYRTLDVSRRRLSSAADAPVEVDCLLEPAP